MSSSSWREHKAVGVKTKLPPPCMLNEWMTGWLLAQDRTVGCRKLSKGRFSGLVDSHFGLSLSPFLSPFMLRSRAYFLPPSCSVELFWYLIREPPCSMSRRVIFTRPSHGHFASPGRHQPKCQPCRHCYSVSKDFQKKKLFESVCYWKHLQFEPQYHMILKVIKSHLCIFIG